MGARSGVGFVTDTERDIDVLIPPHLLNAALPGDRVRVRISSRYDGKSPRLSGAVTSILERAKRDIVGTLQKSGHFYTVMPMSALYKHPFYVADPKEAKAGDRVVLRFTEWTNPALNPEGEIVEVIGPADNPSLDTEAIIRQYELPREFPSSVLREAEHVSSFLKAPGARREDLREKLIITIDPLTAKDFDDAISLEQDEAGHRVLGVHIADVAHFVRPGSALDREALKRGTSVYLPDKVIPMLPEQLSNGVCSLRPDEDRLCLSAFLTFDARGKVTHRRFCRSIIRSALRLTYEEAMDVIAHRQIHTGKAIPNAVRTLIHGAHALAQQLREARFRRGALDLDIPETQIAIDPDGRMTGVRAAEHDVSHELIEECMVAANEAVATELNNAHVKAIARLHEAPDPEKLEELAVGLVAIGISPGELYTPKGLADLMARVKESPLCHYASVLILRSMKKAEYTPDATGHFGLGKKFYSHFTSPIRRYPDLVLHRQLATLLYGAKNEHPSLAELQAVAKTSTELEDRAEQASRDLIEIKKYRFLQQQIDDRRILEYDAVIVKVTEFGLFVEITDLSVSGLIHVTTLSDGFVRYRDGALHAREGSYRMGQTVRVFVAAVNFDQRKVDFGLVTSKGKRTPKRRP